MSTPQNQPITPELPPDVSQYLIEASTEIATEKNFVPDSEEQFELWFQENFQSIIVRASELQAKMISSVLNKPQVKEVVARVLGAQVWGDIRIEQHNERIQSEVDKALHQALTMESHIS